MVKREDVLRSYVDTENGVGLEIGPLSRPLINRKTGCDIYYCDYATRDELIKKSTSDPNVDLDLIPDIDFVSPSIDRDTFGGMLFDYIIASHVIEHVPDVVSWINVLIESLRPSGRLVLAVPDRRFTFDVLRQVSTAGEVIQAHLERRRRPSFNQVYDGFSRAVHANSVDLWQFGPVGRELKPQFSKELALQLAMDSFSNETYHDCHCWVFEYAAFIDLISELRVLGFVHAEIEMHTAPVFGANEFHVILRREQS